MRNTSLQQQRSALRYKGKVNRFVKFYNPPKDDYLGDSNAC